MRTASTMEPRIYSNWSSFGAILVVSVLGPALLLLVTMAPLVAVQVGPLFLEYSLCKYLNACAFGGDSDWASWLVNEHIFFYVLWVSVGAGFACVVTLESAFRIFRRAAPMTVVCWHGTLIFLLTVYFPVDSLRLLLALGWTGNFLVSLHYYLSYGSLPLYRPPEAEAGKTREEACGSPAAFDSTEFHGGFSPQERRAQWRFALMLAAISGLACYALLHDFSMLFLLNVGLALYNGLLLLNQFLASRRADSLIVGGDGLLYRGERLSWQEVGRVWRGPKGYGHVVMIETPAAGAKRLLQASNWINRLFARCGVLRKTADLVAHAVVVDTRSHLGGAAELLQVIEAHRPPGSSWVPAAETA